MLEEAKTFLFSKANQLTDDDDKYLLSQKVTLDGNLHNVMLTITKRFSKIEYFVDKYKGKE